MEGTRSKSVGRSLGLRKLLFPFRAKKDGHTPPSLYSCFGAYVQGEGEKEQEKKKVHPFLIPDPSSLGGGRLLLGPSVVGLFFLLTQLGMLLSFAPTVAAATFRLWPRDGKAI